MDLTAIFGGGATGQLVFWALIAGCGLVMALAPATSLAYKIAHVLDLLLEHPGQLLSGGAPRLSTSSSALRVGGAKAIPPPAPQDAPQVVQGPPEQDQEGLP